MEIQLNISTPFDNLLIKFGSYLWNPQKTDKNKIVIIHEQILVLRLLYASLYSFKIDNIETQQQQAEECLNLLNKSECYRYINRFDNYLFVKIFYFEFISNLLHLASLLNNQFVLQDIDIIKFYRDKVIAHWPEYIKENNIGNGITYKFNKIPVPGGVLGGKPEDIKVLANDLAKYDNSVTEKNVLSKLLEDPYGIFKKINCKLLTEHNLDKKSITTNYISNDLISKLFKIGFPVPIKDLEKYSSDLVEQIKKIKILKCIFSGK
jgi:hypothetical protein